MFAKEAVKNRLISVEQNILRSRWCKTQAPVVRDLFEIPVFLQRAGSIKNDLLNNVLWETVKTNLLDLDPLHHKNDGVLFCTLHPPPLKMVSWLRSPQSIRY